MFVVCSNIVRHRSRQKNKCKNKSEQNSRIKALPQQLGKGHHRSRDNRSPDNLGPDKRDKRNVGRPQRRRNRQGSDQIAGGEGGVKGLADKQRIRPREDRDHQLSQVKRGDQRQVTASVAKPGAQIVPRWSLAARCCKTPSAPSRRVPCVICRMLAAGRQRPDGAGNRITRQAKKRIASTRPSWLARAHGDFQK